MHELILMAEDEEADAILVRRVVRHMQNPMALHIVRHGEEAIEYLSGKGEYGNREKYPFPTIVLLDLKMPRVGGFEVLEWIKENAKCAVVPVIVWSSSSLETDIKRAYELGANCYLVKPNSFDEIKQLIDLTFTFWSLCRRPHLSGSCIDANRS